MVAIDRRVGYIFVAFLALLAVAVARAGYLGVIQAGSLQRDAVSEQITDEPVPAMRGAITDSTGVELALSESADDVIADPILITQHESAMQLAQMLAPRLHLPVLTVLATLTKPHSATHTTP